MLDNEGELCIVVLLVQLTSFACVVSKVHIIRLIHVITHFSLQPKVPLNKVVSALELLLLHLLHSNCHLSCRICFIASRNFKKILLLACWSVAFFRLFVCPHSGSSTEIFAIFYHQGSRKEVIKFGEK